MATTVDFVHAYTAVNNSGSGIYSFLNSYYMKKNISCQRLGLHCVLNVSLYRNHQFDTIHVRVNSNPRIPFVTQESLFVNENPVL